MAKKQKLELTWVGKDERPKLEPRILIEDPSRSYHAKVRHSDDDIFDNILIKGDNLLALKALEQDYAGKVKCIYIDPPYNTGDMFEFYDDGLEHSIWLSKMRDRFVLAKKLLSVDGVFFCQLNDDEMAYAKVLLDEIFGRQNFLNHVSVRMKLTAGASGGGEDKKLKKNLEHILIYTKDNYSENGFVKFNDVYDSTDLLDYIEGMQTAGKSWKYTSVLVGKGKFIEERIVLTGDGEEIVVKKYAGVERTTVNQLMKQGHSKESVYFEHLDGIFSDTNAQTSIRTRIIDEFLSLKDGELLEASYVPKSGREKGQLATHYYISKSIRRVIWLKDIAQKEGARVVKREKVGTYWEGFPLNNLTKEGGVRFPQGKKPEALIKKIFELATNEGDLILDSFAGSGTTAAVAQKMNRRWITVEIGDHADTHIVPRLQKVIDGEDSGGITKSVDWKGGGGFRYYTLAPSLLETDKFGNWVISKDYNPAML
ncbi:site-specific DNA-methyltransferase, partial [Hellea sp.]|nr:site-specific DNA-methyltransferase [Hellea sp.]